MTRSKTWRSRGAQIMLALTAAMAAGGAARAQEEIPTVISPLRVESDHNNVNLVSGRTTVEPPVLSVPAAPNLRFDRVQNAAPYVSGRVTGGPGEYPMATYSVHSGKGGSESFRCPDYDCASVTGTGSTFQHGSRVYRQAGSGARWNFTLQHVNTIGPPRVLQYYASSVTYPNGETISYTYQTATLPGDPFNRTFYRPVTVTSNLGYFISISYHPGALGEMGWNQASSATLFASAAPTVPLGRLTYSLDGTSITQYGAQDQNPRTFSCTGCANGLGSNIEVWAGSLQLPTEASPTLQVTAAAGGNVVGSVTRDGVGWSYSYLNLRPHYETQSWLYDRLTVTGPNGFNQVYNVAQIGLGPQQRNVVTSMTDSIGRSTSFLFDEAYRPTQMVLPEGNQVNVAYDEYGNLFWRRTRAKAGSGLADIIEQAGFPGASLPNLCTVLCWRPVWSRDGLNRQTDYVYNGNGQLIEQTDPADANGIRRRTITEYASASNGVSRRSVIRVCGVGTTCGTNQEIRTEYYYGSHTLLPTLERRWNLAAGAYLDTTYGYDAAGRLTSTDGPLAGSDDAAYVRYDEYGRKTWEIGAVGANGLRTARRHTYRNSDDKPTVTETGTVPTHDSWTLTALTRADIGYDARRNPERESVSSGGTTYTVTQRTFDQRNRLECQAIRMNPTTFAALPASACTLATQGSFGPDRITRKTYDAGDQLLIEQRAYGTALQQNYATYTYSAHGKLRSVTDANGNRAELRYDGHDRQIRWVFPHPSATGAVNEADYEAYTYDLVGNRTSLRKRDGSTLTFQYDNLNRMTLKVVPERAGLSSTHTRDVHYGYDLRNLELHARFDSQSGEGVSNAYDAFGRLVSSTLAMDGVSRTLSGLYRGDDARERLTHPDGQSFTYTYSPAAQLTGIYQGIGTGTMLAQFGYHPNARPSIRLDGPGSNATYGYDPIGRLNSQTDAFIGGAGNVTVGLGYNPASQITLRTRDNDAYASNTAYNVSRNYAVNGLNQYMAAGPASFSYDGNGNLTSDGSTTFTYDVENRLVSASVGVALRYDPLGRLYEVSGPSGTTRFLHDGDALVGEYVGGALTERYVHGSNADADDPLVWYDNGIVRYLHANHQRSIVALTTGAAPAINAYDEWGIPNAANQGRFQYTGQAYIPELGMYYYKARIYSPTLGRFLQVDPVGYEDHVNLYAYVGNDPVNSRDTSGLGCEALEEALRCDPPGDEIGSYTIPLPRNHGVSSIPESSSTYSSYTVGASTTETGSAVLQSVTQEVISDPTPGSDRPATPQGTLNDAGINPLATFGPTGDLVASFVTVDSNGNTVVVNLAIPGNHVFAPAVVSQVISQNGQGTRITLVGESTSPLHQGRMNPVNALARVIFQRKINGDIRAGVRNVRSRR